MKKLLSRIASAWQGANLMLRILIGIIVGTVLALTLPGLHLVAVPGILFVGALKAIAPVLVAVLVVSSVARARAGIGGRFRTVIGLYVVSTLLAATLAVLASRQFPVEMVLAGVSGADNQAPQQLGDVFSTIAHNLMSNPVEAVAGANYLSILLWAIIIGLALKKTASPSTIDIVSEWAETISTVVRWV